MTLMSFAQQTPAKEQEESILIKNVIAHIGNGTIIKNAAIAFDKGKIVYIGENENIDENNFTTIIEGKGKHLYPGFIALNTSLGLAEIDAVRPTRDFDEIGDFLPHIRSIIAYNAESKVVESMRPNGILIAQITPRGGFISGTSSVVQLDAWNWEDAVVKYDDAIHLNWPSPYKRGRWWLGEDPALKKDKNYEKNVLKVKHFFQEAKAYKKNSVPKNIVNEAMVGVFEGSKNVYLHADNQKEIVDGISFLKSMNIDNIVLVGGIEANLQIEILKKNNIPVVIARPHRLPSNEDEDIKLPFKMAKILMDKGLLVGIDITGRMERMNTRNLPFYAGTFASYGVPKEKAVEMITLNSAKILGIDKKMGSLEKGKEATFFISKGDALDMRTNQISYAFIQGRKISLESHQTELWKRYNEKYKIATKN